MKQVFYSEKLKKYFNSEEECVSAEEAFDRQQQRQQQQKDAAKAQRAADAKAVEAARQKVIDTKQTAAKAMQRANSLIDEAEKDYAAARKAFIEKYGSYHMTVSDDDEEEFSIADIIGAILSFVQNRIDDDA